MVDSMDGRKSVFFAYLFALIGGPFGLHHLYLGRTQHALLWFTTFGGFIVGWIYELFFLIPKYVRETNCDHQLMLHYYIRMRQMKSPAFEITRLCGQYLTSLVFGFLTYYAFPDTWHQQAWKAIFVAGSTVVAIALGTKLVGTVGPRQCSFVWPLFGAFLGIPLLIRPPNVAPSFNISIILCCLIFEWKIEWNFDYFPISTMIKSTDSSPSITLKQMRIKRRHIMKRCLFYGLGALIFMSVFTSAIYQNLQVDVDGRRMKIKDVLADFFRSQEFLLFYEQLKRILHHLFSFYMQYGVKGLWKQIWAILDFENQQQAFKVLNLPNNASQKDIETQCRTLSRQWHPDRYRKAEEKQNAQTIFMNIQQACDRLSHERRRRQTLNTVKRENP